VWVIARKERNGTMTSIAPPAGLSATVINTDERDVSHYCRGIGG